jgi:chromosome segregation ATPase
MENYIPKIKEIVGEYQNISNELESLASRIETLEILRKSAMMKLEANREEERRLIDKIKNETGEPVDFLKIMNLLKNESA